MPPNGRPSNNDAMKRGADQGHGRAQPRRDGAPNAKPAASDGRHHHQQQEWPESDWDGHDEAASHKARRLLKRPAIGMNHITDGAGRFRAIFARGRWPRKVAWTLATLASVSAIGFAALWLRLGAGPINLDIVTPWLATAIEENLGKDHTVEVGGTQIERAGRIRIAVRIRDILVKDRNRNVVASAPKAEVRLSGTALLLGRLRAESLRLVGAELSVRISPDGDVTVTTGNNTQPLATGKVPVKPRDVADGTARPSSATPSPVLPSGGTVASNPGGNALMAALDWLDTLGAKGLDGQDLGEIGLRNGSLTVDDQQNNSRVTFQNITLNLRRPFGGGIAASIGEEGGPNAWSLKFTIASPSNGVRSFEVDALKVPPRNLLLAGRFKDLTYNTVDMPITGTVKGEIGRDGMPTYIKGEVSVGKGSLVDRNVPDYPMDIDSLDAKLDWDANRRVLVAPFYLTSGANRFTMIAHLDAPNGATPFWQLALSGGTVVLSNQNSDAPLVMNRIAIRLQFDTARRRTLLSQCDISNGEIGIAGSGVMDYSGAEPRLTLGLASTPMPASALKDLWPILVVPEVREWALTRVSTGSIQRLDVAINAPVHTLARNGPPIPDDGLSINFLANNVTILPVDELPAVRDADMKGTITGRTATVSVAQAGIETPAGRKLNLSDFVFEIPDFVPKPIPTKVRFRIEGPVPAAAEILQSDRLSDVTGTLIDPNASKGTVAAVINMTMPLKKELTRADTNYSVNVDLGALAVDKLAMNQKLEANNLKVVADNQGYRVKGDVKIGGQPAVLDYRKLNEGDADVRLSATLDDASRSRLGVDLGSTVTGAIPIKLIGKIGDGDRENRFGVEADLTPARIDNLLPGWTKVAGKASKMTFNVVQKAQGTRFEDIVVEGGGASIKGVLEVDQNNDLVSASFPTFSPSEGDKASLRADRAADGTLKVTMRGEVFDGRGFIKGAMSGKDGDSKSKQKIGDIDIDAKMGAIAGFYGEAVRNVDVKISRRGGVIRSFGLSGKLGRDTPISGSMKGRAQGRDVLYLETNDAGAFFRFTDIYPKMFGGQMWIAMDPPTGDSTPQEGLLNVGEFYVKGETALDRVVAGGGGANSSGIGFSRMRAEFTRQTGQLRIREGVVRGPTVGATVEGNIDYAANQVRMSGTFVPMYGLNNIFGQIPIVGLVLGGGSNEGLIGITYEVIGSPGAPVLRVNPISAMAPGVFRKIFEFGTGKQQVPQDFSSPGNNN